MHDRVALSPESPFSSVEHPYEGSLYFDGSSWGGYLSTGLNPPVPLAFWDVGGFTAEAFVKIETLAAAFVGHQWSLYPSMVSYTSRSASQ